MKLGQLVYKNVLTIKSVFKRYYSNQHLSEFYLQDGGENWLAYTVNELTLLSAYVL